MNINDGSGIFDKYGVIGKILEQLELLADAKGVLRCGLIWNITDMVKALENGMKNEDAARGSESFKTTNEIEKEA